MIITLSTTIIMVRIIFKKLVTAKFIFKPSKNVESNPVLIDEDDDADSQLAEEYYAHGYAVLHDQIINIITNNN